MLPHLPPTVSVEQAGRVVAVCTFNQVYLDHAIGAMPASHPDRALIGIKCLIAGAILRGEANGPYDHDLAEMTARILVGEPAD